MFNGLKTIFDWKGRLGRLQFLIVLIAVMVAASLIGTIFGHIRLVGFLAQLAVLPSAIKRIHDIGWSTWWLLLSLVPGLGLIMEIILLVVPGKK